MARSIKKGPFIDEHLAKKVEAAVKNGDKNQLKLGQEEVPILPRYDWI